MPTPIYNLATIDNRLQQVVAALQATPPSWLRLLDAGGNRVSSFQLSGSVGQVSNGILVFDSLPLIDPSAVGGLPVSARLEDANGVIIADGLTVSGAAGSDIVLSPSTTIPAGAAVGLSAAQITGH